MKITLLMTPSGFDSKSRFRDLTTFSLAPYHLAGQLARAGFDVSTIDSIEISDEFLGEDKLLERLRETTIVAFSVNTFNVSTTRIVLRRIKAVLPTIKSLIGGVHPTYYPEKSLAFTGADYALTGESDFDIVAFCQAIERKQSLESVCNLHWFDEQGVHRSTANSAALKHFDRVPWGPYLEDLPKNTYQCAPYESSRGCYFSCYFCSICSRHNWRGKSTPIVLHQLTSYLPTLEGVVNTNGVLFTDDCFTGNVDRAEEILRGIRDLNLKVKLMITARISDMVRSPALMDRISEVKPFNVEVGIESGYNEGLAKLKKGFTVDQVIRCMDALKARNISRNVRLSFIIGLPFETYSDITKTIAFAAYCMERYDATVSVAWWIPAPSKLWDDLPQFGITPREDDFYFYQYERDQRLFHYYHSNITPSLTDRIGKIERFLYAMGLSPLEVHTLPLNRPVRWQSNTDN